MSDDMHVIELDREEVAIIAAIFAEAVKEGVSVRVAVDDVDQAFKMSAGRGTWTAPLGEPWK